MLGYFKYITTLVLLLTLVLNAEAKQFVVVIDPGHGGKDYGAIGATTNEKTINLNVAKKLGDKIKEKYSTDDVKVVYTRDKDVFIALNERAKIANNANGDLFISIHVNSLPKKNKRRATVSGAEVYTCGLHRSESNLAVAQRENAVMYLEEDYSQKYQGFDPNSPESYIAFELNQSMHLDRSIEFATLAKDYLVKTAGRADKGVKQAGFWVLWSVGMPSVLVELDFISNPNAERFMASSNGVDKMAKSLYQAFEEYYVAIEGNRPAIAPSKEVEDNDNTFQQNNSGDSNDLEIRDNTSIGIEYRVQVLANDTQLSLSSKLFKGENVNEYFDKGMYKYTVGHHKTKHDAEIAMRKLRKKFPQAFVIKMENGKRVNL